MLYLQFLRYLKKECKNRFLTRLENVSLHFYVDIEKFQYTICFVNANRKMKFCLDKQGFARALLMDLSKAFHTINHKLLIAKLHAYGFSTDALEILLSYLQDR